MCHTSYILYISIIINTYYIGSICILYDNLDKNIIYERQIDVLRPTSPRVVIPTAKARREVARSPPLRSGHSPGIGRREVTFTTSPRAAPEGASKPSYEVKGNSMKRF